MGDLVIRTFPSVPSYRTKAVLDGRAYVLDFRWSALEARWYLDIRDAAGELLAGAVKLVANFYLLASRRTEALPPGELVALDPRPSPADPGFADLGDTVHLIYREAEA